MASTQANKKRLSNEVDSKVSGPTSTITLRSVSTNSNDKSVHLLSKNEAIRTMNHMKTYQMRM